MAITGYSGPTVPSGGMQLLRNESTSDSLAAMLGPGGLQASRHGGGLEDAVAMQQQQQQQQQQQGGGAGQKRPFFATYDGPTVEDGPDDVGDVDGGEDLSLAGGSQLEKKRRLTFDQVRSLERNFEVENKLEPERKMQLAKELGLRPRQVAVWFQNRRARWKTKQLERDYESLAADYERLKADYDQVVGEKNHLKAEVQRLAGATTTTLDDGVTPALESAQAGETTTAYCVAAPEFVSRHHNARSSPTVDVSLACANPKEETSGCTDGSNSSDVLDADSPRTADSSSPARTATSSEHTVIHSPDSTFPPESCFMAPGNMLQDITAGVKLEDESGAFHEVDPSCNYLLLQLDEQSVLPWWDWP